MRNHPWARLCIRAATATVATAASLGVLAGAPVMATAVADPDPGLIGVRLVDAPVARRDDPRARRYIVDHLRPGTTIKRRIEVYNKSAAARRLDLYAASAGIHKNTFTFGQKHTANELSGWIKVNPAWVVLAPRARTQAMLTVTVPRTALDGERYAVVWAEAQAAPDAQHNVGSIHRVGVRVYLDVGPGGEPLSDFVIERMTGARDEQGRPSVTAVVRNLGRRAVDLSGQLTLAKGPGGVTAGPFRAPPGTTLSSHGSGTVVVPLEPRLPDGPWKATLELRSGPAKRSATATVMLSQWKEPTSYAHLYAIGAAVALVVCGLIAWVLIRRRRRNRAQPADQPSP
ncbi:peptidase [Streptomyces sp. NPDC059828]|uniref:peptidase n=1 Tax=Streptomyces sp. NPDC059828 TaxID=3346965 RepID=UPI003647FA3E